MKKYGTYIGIDVGGESKGFHAVVLIDNKFADKKAHRDPAEIVGWCLDRKADMIGVDAPCKWSQAGSSRLAERELGGIGIHCFYTPTEEIASHRDFYQWVFSGRRLYDALKPCYPLYNGAGNKEPMCIETFPHAVVCAMAGRVVAARPKSRTRRRALESRGYDASLLPNIDFVDAALCALTAYEFSKGNYIPYGNSAEGFIIVPKAIQPISQQN